jgi:hypothetical protein
MYTEELDDALRERELTLLCDAIFAANDVCKVMKGISDETLPPMESIIASAMRIPVEWSMLMMQDMPLLACPVKLKLFQSRPRGLIEMGTLLANFKLCVKGENITKYIGLYPPTLRGYLMGKVSRDY